MKDNNQTCTCSICGKNITDRHDISYRYCFRKGDYTNEIICLNCDEQQNDEMADDIAGYDDW